MTQQQAIQAARTATNGSEVSYRSNERARNVRVAREPYPLTVAESIEPGRKYKPEVLRAVRDFAKSKPFRGSDAERFAKFAALHVRLCEAYGIFPVLRRGAPLDGHSGGSCFQPGENVITLNGKLSAITYLHEFGYALGKGERGTCKWSLNLFARCFPRSFASLTPQGHTLVQA